MVGKTISHYRITAELGDGGMGVVDRPSDTKLNRCVAIRLLPQHLPHDLERMDRVCHRERTE